MFVRDTNSYGLEYKKNDKFILTRYMKANYGGSLHDRRSIIGYVFFLIYRPILYGSNKYSIKSNSTIELEYHVAVDIVCEAIWLRRTLTNIGIL